MLKVVNCEIFKNGEFLLRSVLIWLWINNLLWFWWCLIRVGLLFKWILVIFLCKLVMRVVMLLWFCKNCGLCGFIFDFKIVIIRFYWFLVNNLWLISMWWIFEVFVLILYSFVLCNKWFVVYLLI